MPLYAAPIARTADAQDAAPAQSGEADKWVAKVRVTHKGYSMELSKYIAYALPEGVHELYAAPQPAQTASVDDLAMLVKKLVRHVRKASPDNNMAIMAMDYLIRHGLEGSALRNEAAPTGKVTADAGSREALRRLENACEAIAKLRTQEQYRSEERRVGKE